MTRRFIWVVLIAITSVFLMAAGFSVGWLIRSPNDDAVTNAQHSPTVSAIVEEHTFVLSGIQRSGTLALGKSWSVNIPANEGIAPVVTGVVTPSSSSFESGSVLATVSGRPVIGLELSFDLYREILGGDSGEDISEIQLGLQQLGLYEGVIDGYYGVRTALAMEELYRRVGYEPPKPPEAALESLAEAEADRDAAKLAMTASPNDKNAIVAFKTAENQYTKKSLAVLTPVKPEEIISLPSPSVFVVSVAEVNTHLSATEPLAKLRSGDASATVRVGVGDKDSFLLGTLVEVQASTDISQTTTGTVSSVSDFSQADPNNGKLIPGYDITIAISQVDGFNDGQDVKILVGSGESITGLAVPVTALRQDGKNIYVISSETGKQVPVTVNLVSDGYAMVEHTTLAAGDSVVIS